MTEQIFDQKYANWSPSFDDSFGNILQNRTVPNVLMSSSIDTSAIDRFRQGVELTLMKHFDMGLYHITSGEPGHKCFICEYGQDLNADFRMYYSDEENNPKSEVIINLTQQMKSAINLHTFPEYIPDPQTPTISAQFNGIIELYMQRKVGSTDKVIGVLEDGNPDAYGSSEFILNSYPYNPHNHKEPFLDVIQVNNGIATYDVEQYENFVNRGKVETYIDVCNEKLISMIPYINVENDVLNVLCTLKYGDENSVPIGEKMAATGFMYDNAPFGDSIAFGGIGY